MTLSQQALYWLAYRRAKGLQPPVSMFYAAADAAQKRLLRLRDHVGWNLCNEHGESCLEARHVVAWHVGPFPRDPVVTGSKPRPQSND